MLTADCGQSCLLQILCCLCAGKGLFIRSVLCDLGNLGKELFRVVQCAGFQEALRHDAQRPLLFSQQAGHLRFGQGEIGRALPRGLDIVKRFGRLVVLTIGMKQLTHHKPHPQEVRVLAISSRRQLDNAAIQIQSLFGIALLYQGIAQELHQQRVGVRIKVNRFEGIANGLARPFKFKSNRNNLLQDGQAGWIQPMSTLEHPRRFCLFAFINFHSPDGIECHRFAAVSLNIAQQFVQPQSHAVFQPCRRPLPVLLRTGSTGLQLRAESHGHGLRRADQTTNDQQAGNRIRDRTRNIGIPHSRIRLARS